ncbi:hypothetical protein B0H14DRAFT_3476480 [Mycena olivaceomarginata]|nr:hypothetical protein B0H14DRAFT_3476480 [Mycena olivaceomarginata]
MRDVPTHAPLLQSPRPTAHHQERGPAAEQSLTRRSRGFFLRSSLPPTFLPQVRVCVNAAQAAGPEARAHIVDAICADGGVILIAPIAMDTVQRCLEAVTGPEERRQIVACMRGCIVDLTTLYTDHVPQNSKKALDCEEEITELSRTPPAPPIFAWYVTPPLLIDAEYNPSSLSVSNCLMGKWAALAYHETRSLVPQCAVEKSETGSLTAAHTRRRGTWRGREEPVGLLLRPAHPRTRVGEEPPNDALEQPLTALLQFTANKRAGNETLARAVQRMRESAKGARRAIIVDLALAHEERADRLRPPYDGPVRGALRLIRARIVTLCACKTGSKVIWLFDRMRADCGH